MTPELLSAARALCSAITKDDAGILIGTIWQGGNGGLLSNDTLRARDHLLRLLDAIEGTPEPDDIRKTVPL